MQYLCQCFSRKTHINELKEKLARLVKTDRSETLQLVGDLVHPADLVVLVIPIDKAAPKGRLILPQQQVIRDVLEAGRGGYMCERNMNFRGLPDTDLGKRPAYGNYGQPGVCTGKCRWCRKKFCLPPFLF